MTGRGAKARTAKDKFIRMVERGQPMSATHHFVRGFGKEKGRDDSPATKFMIGKIENSNFR